MKLRKNQTGFSAIEVLLVLILLAIVAFAGYYVYHAQKKSAGLSSTAQPAGDNSNSAAFTSDDPTAKKAVMDNQLTFKYPADWTLTQTPTSTDSGGTTMLTTVSAPASGTYVQIKRQTAGVGGVFCMDNNGGSAGPVNVVNLGKHILTDYSNFTLVTGYAAGSGSLINVTSTANANQLKEGSNACVNYFEAQAPADLFNTSDGGYSGAWVTISNPSMDAITKQGAVVSESDYNSFINSTDFSTAVTIVQTIKKL